MDSEVVKYQKSYEEKLELKEVFVYKKTMIGIPSSIFVPLVAFCFVTMIIVNLLFGFILLVLGLSFLYNGFQKDNEYIHMLFTALSYRNKLVGFKGSDNFSINIIKK